MTSVVFRKFKEDGDIIALFPEESWNPDKGTIASYMHTGQHGDADYHHVLAKTRPARENEYRPLLAELKRIGYDDLRVMQRCRPECN
jgi:hypothetical protein